MRITLVVATAVLGLAFAAHAAPVSPSHGPSSQPAACCHAAAG